MQRFISKYGLAAHLAFLTVAPLFLSPIAIIWLTAVAMVWVVMEPSRFGSENLHEARRRSFRTIISDPAFWLSLFLVVFALVRMLNDGVARSYDAETAKWFLSQPEYPILPGAVEGVGLSELALALALIPILQGCRNVLGKSSREMYAVLVTFFAGVVTSVWFILYVKGNEAAAKLIEYNREVPSYFGAAFGVYFVMSASAVYSIVERGWYRSLIPAMIGVIGTGTALFFYAPPEVVVLFAGATLMVFIYGFVRARIKIGNAAEFKYMVLFWVPIAAVVALAMEFMDPSTLESRIAPFLTGKFLTDDFLALRSLLDGISLKIWKLHPWIGSGLGSFTSAMPFHVLPEDWSHLSPLQSAPLNGYWLLLVERGTIGAFMMGSMLVLLFWRFVTGCWQGIKLRALPHPAVWVGLLALVVAAVEAVIDVSFLSPGMTAAIAASFALSANSFPKEKQKHG